MANFLLTFHGGSMPETKEAQDQVMAAWTGWFGTLGDALVDGGNPISQAKAISPDGSVMDATSAPSGYSIIKADSLDAAWPSRRAVRCSPAARRSSSRRRSRSCRPSRGWCPRPAGIRSRRPRRTIRR